mgnify:FL=1
MADLKESFSKGLTALNVKTSTFLEAKKIQTYISTLNNEIEALQKEIGRRAYEDWEKNGSISLSNIGEQLMEISKKKETIAQQKIAAEELEKKEQQILDTADNQKPSKIFCPNCGQSYDGPVKFCRKCGTKLQ